VGFASESIVRILLVVTDAFGPIEKYVTVYFDNGEEIIFDTPETIKEFVAELHGMSPKLAQRVELELSVKDRFHNNYENVIYERE